MFSAPVLLFLLSPVLLCVLEGDNYYCAVSGCARGTWVLALEKAVVRSVPPHVQFCAKLVPAGIGLMGSELLQSFAAQPDWLKLTILSRDQGDCVSVSLIS